MIVAVGLVLSSLNADGLDTQEHLATKAQDAVHRFVIESTHTVSSAPATA